VQLGEYWGVVRRRWWLIGVIVLLDVVVSGYLYRKADVHAGSQSCLTLYVADVSAPSTISAPQTTLETAGQLLAGETAANFFADDLLDVAQSRSVAAYMKQRAASSRGLVGSDVVSGFVGSVSGSRLDRTVNLCVTKPDAATAQAGASALARAMTTDRYRFIGRQMAKRTFVNVISAPQVGPAPTGHASLTFLLRVGLGVLVALGLAFLWDALDPAVRGRRDVESALGVPVLGSD
jgi:capsular polysaccharide biosynthesis protein